MSEFIWNDKTNVCKNPMLVYEIDKKPFKVRLWLAEFRGKWDCSYVCFLSNSGAGRLPWKSCCEHLSKDAAIENAVKEVLKFIYEEENYFEKKCPGWLKDEVQSWIPSRQLTLF